MRTLERLAAGSLALTLALTGSSARAADAKKPAAKPAAAAAAKAAPAAAAKTQQKKDATPVAKIGADTITAAELDAEAGPKLQELERDYQEKLYAARRETLDKLIQNRLFAAKAKEAGISVEEYLHKVQAEILAQVPEPSPDEVKRLYDQAVSSGQKLPPFEQVKEEIVQYIKSQRADPVAQQFLEGLRKDAKVQILLPPYRPEPVAVDAKGPSRGNAKAPVTIVEFSDYQCPFCVKAEPAVSQLLAAYPDQVRVVYRDFPLDFHPYAQKAAEAAQCADAQGKFWAMHDRLFKAGGQGIAVDDLKGFAKELGLDQARFDKCLDEGETAEVVAASKAAGEAAGVTGTPAFYINGRPFSGALPFDQLRSLVEAELRDKGISAKK